MSDSSVFLALIAIVAGVVATATTTSTFAQKKVVEVLEKALASERQEKTLVAEDNRKQAATIVKLGASIDKLTDQGAQTIRLLEDVVYGRESTARRRNPGD